MHIKRQKNNNLSSTIIFIVDAIDIWGTSLSLTIHSIIIFYCTLCFGSPDLVKTTLLKYEFFSSFSYICFSVLLGFLSCGADSESRSRVANSVSIVIYKIWICLNFTLECLNSRLLKKWVHLCSESAIVSLKRWQKCTLMFSTC